MQDIQIDSLHILNIYAPPDDIPTSQFWTNLFKNTASSCIIAGDPNTRSITWGNSDNNQAGKFLLASLVHHLFFILNDGTHTRVPNFNQSPSAPDITLISSNLYLQAQWQVYYKTGGSDHLPILTFLQRRPSANSVASSPFKGEKLSRLPPILSWSAYQTQVTQDALLLNQNQASMSLNDLETLIRQSVQTLSREEQSCFSNTRRKKHTTTPPWWTIECQKWANLRHHKLKLYLHNKTWPAFLEYKRINALVKRHLKRLRRHHWKDYVSNLYGPAAYQFLWKYLHKHHRTASTSVTGTTITTSWIQDFHQSLTPPTVLQDRQDIALLLERG